MLLLPGPERVQGLPREPAPLPQARVAAARSEWDAQNSRLAVRVTLDLGGEQAGLEVRI